MSTIASTAYCLENEKKANWSTAQENSLSTEFSFDLTDETPEGFLHRSYLQFLWLPESIMPIRLLVPTMRRIQPASSSSSEAHPLHALLDELLLTVPSMKTKYRTELQRVLVNGGGSGEAEEEMMWYALTNEHADMPDPWLDVPWREKWMDKLERREVQIQILLYFLKLSLPPIPEGPKAKGKRKRELSPEITTEDYLEAFMDMLSMWQLLDGVKPSNSNKPEDRDWMQVFCEDVVEREFKSTLPELCDLLRSKVFPHSPFSDHESNASTSRASSPAEESRGADRAPSLSGPRSSKPPDPRALAKERSRSLSVSLAQEREQSTVAAGKRRMGTREISMSRVFKPKPKPPAPKPSEKAEPEASQSQSQSQSQSKYGTTLVEETPAKPTRTMSQVFPSTSARGLFGRKDSSMAGTDNDEAWQIDSSPDITLLASPGKEGGEGEDEDVDMTPATPSRPSRAVKTRGKATKRK